METSFRSEETFTQEEFRGWLERLSPSDLHHYELIRGRIVMSPPAGGWHGNVEASLSGLIGSHVRTRGLGLMFGASTGFELPSGDTLEPDVAFVSSERWNAGPRPIRNEFVRIVPTLVVEILSPSTARRDRTEKLEVYAQNGVDEYWIVDWRRREITIFQRSAQSFAAPATFVSGRVESAVLPGLNVRVEDVFADLAR